MTTPPKGFALWVQAIRPKTLGMAISPIVMGTALAWTGADVVIHPEAPLVILLCAIAIQAGTNLFNDAQDYLNGTDDAERLGPPRVTSQGWALPHQVSAAGLTAFLIALLGGLYLITSGGWPIFFLGLGSLWAGYLYSHGPYPVSRSPFGEVVVIAFFGIAAVGGSVYLQTGTISHTAWLWGLAMGLPAGAVLLLNNVRDRVGDQQSGRRTLAILVGEKTSYQLYDALMLGPLILVIFSVALGMTSMGALAGLATLPLALKTYGLFAPPPAAKRLTPCSGRRCVFRVFLPSARQLD